MFINKSIYGFKTGSVLYKPIHIGWTLVILVLTTIHIDDEGGQTGLRICCNVLVSSAFPMAWLIDECL